MTNHAAERVYLLTGATGNLGFALLRHLMRETNDKVVAAVRPKSVSYFEQLVATQLPDFDRTRLVCLPLDIVTPWYDWDEDVLRDVTDVVHTAGDVRWHAPGAELLKTNVWGTANLLDFCEHRQHARPLHRISVCSSAYVSGRDDRKVPEGPLLPARGFNNRYESSKLLAERDALSRMRLPVNVMRPSMLVGDSRTGFTNSFTSAYYPLRLLYRGHVPLLPGRPDALINLMPLDVAASAIVRAHELSLGPHQIVNICDSRSMSLLEMWRRSADIFNQLRPAARARRVGYFVPPELASRAMSMLGQTARNLALYVPYMNMQRTFANEGFLRLIGGAPPAPSSYLATLCEHAAKHEFQSLRRRMRSHAVAA